MSGTAALGLDLGGSSIKATLLNLDSDGRHRIERTQTWPLHGDRTPEGVVSAVGRIAEHFGRVDHYGMAIPGIIDIEHGLALVMPNFPPAWREYPIGAAIADAVGRSPALINDAKAFSLAETTLGSGRGWDLVASVVLGTGVGGGIVQHGRLWMGAGTAGEFGHIIVEVDGPLCGCGSRGCVEAIAGGEAIERAAGQPSVEAVFAAAAAGDRRARGALDRATSALAAAIAGISATIAPDVFVIGGGIAAAGDTLLEPLRRKVAERIRIIPPDRIRVVAASLGRQAGSIGAALNSIDVSDARA